MPVALYFIPVLLWKAVGLVWFSFTVCISFISIADDNWSPSVTQEKKGVYKHICCTVQLSYCSYTALRKHAGILLPCYRIHIKAC